MTTTHDNSLDEILAEEFLGLGAIGKYAIHAMWEAYADGDFADWLADTGTSQEELRRAMLSLTIAVVSGDHLDDIRTLDGWEYPGV